MFPYHLNDKKKISKSFNKTTTNIRRNSFDYIIIYYYDMSSSLLLCKVVINIM